MKKILEVLKCLFRDEQWSKLLRKKINTVGQFVNKWYGKIESSFQVVVNVVLAAAIVMATWKLRPSPKECWDICNKWTDDRKKEMLRTLRDMRDSKSIGSKPSECKSCGATMKCKDCGVVLLCLVCAKAAAPKMPAQSICTCGTPCECQDCGAPAVCKCCADKLGAVVPKADVKKAGTHKPGQNTEVDKLGQNTEVDKLGQNTEVDKAACKCGQNTEGDKAACKCGQNTEGDKAACKCGKCESVPKTAAAGSDEAAGKSAGGEGSPRDPKA
jgi:hypothetical protein